MTDADIVELAAYRTGERMRSYTNLHRPSHSQIADSFRMFGEEILKLIREHRPQ